MEAKERVKEEEEIEEKEEKQVWWSWGAGTEGQLGTGILDDVHVPQLLPSLSSLGPISSLSCGGAHVIALTTGGKVLTWGRGTSGQLGHGEMVNSLQPKHVDFFNSSLITHVSAGWNHSGFVSDTGCLFTCGDGSFGQLGHGDYNSQCYPVKVSYFESRHVEQVACGMRHSLALLKGDSGDQVYGFGSGKRGQLGISMDKIKSISLPQSTLGLEDVNTISICANGDHSGALSADGHLYYWGRGFSGTSDVYCPHAAIASSSFTQAALGWNHALLLTDDGDIFMLGGNSHGVLSNQKKTNLVKHTTGVSSGPLVQRVLSVTKVLHIAVGAEHSVLVTGEGDVMTWGWGEHGQLGLNSTDDQIDPQVVSLGDKVNEEHSTSKVYCGSGFTFAVRT